MTEKEDAIVSNGTREPRTESGRALVVLLADADIRWPDNDTRIAIEAVAKQVVRVERQAAETARRGLDRDALQKVALGLDVLHSTHFDWGCTAQTCSGQEAIDIITAEYDRVSPRNEPSHAD